MSLTTHHTLHITHYSYMMHSQKSVKCFLAEFNLMDHFFFLDDFSDIILVQGI
jgi:hypothetical protein